jgi:zinc ribbon protein
LRKEAAVYCPRCGVGQPDEHRFCFACGTPLPRSLLPARGPKLSQWFEAMPVAPTDPAKSFVRVSCYLEEIEVESEGATVRIPSNHVRFSIWVDDQAMCAASLPDDEARALARFVLEFVPDGAPV